MKMPNEKKENHNGCEISNKKCFNPNYSDTLTDKLNKTIKMLLSMEIQKERERERKTHTEMYVYK